MVSLKGFNPGDKVGVMLNTGEYFWTYVMTFIDGALALLNPLPAPAAAGAIVTDFGPEDSPLTAGGLVTESGALFGIKGGGYIGINP